MEPETAFYERAMRRIYRFMGVLACGGVLAAAWFGDWRWAASFLLGGMGSYLNFSWVHGAVEALGPGGRPTRKRLFVFVALRYGILGAGGYVIVKVFGMNAIALIVGLFVPVAAVILEILYELTHAGT